VAACAAGAGDAEEDSCCCSEAVVVRWMPQALRDWTSLTAPTICRASFTSPTTLMIIVGMDSLKEKYIKSVRQKRRKKEIGGTKTALLQTNETGVESVQW